MLLTFIMHTNTTSQINRYFDLTLDVQTGCIHKCYGCHVDREETNGISIDDVNRLISLAKGFKERNYILGNLYLGPTDFMTASNTLDIFELLSSSKLIDEFKTITFNTSLLGKREVIIKWAETVNKSFKGSRYKLIVLIDPRHANKEKYITEIVSKINLFQENVPDAHLHKVYLTSNLKKYDDTDYDPFINVEHMSKIKFNFKVDYDLALSHGRLDLTDLNNKLKFKEALLYLRNFHAGKMVSNELHQLYNFNDIYRFGRHDHNRDSDNKLFQEITIAYKGGSLYHIPFIGQHVVVYNDLFKVDSQFDWTPENILFSELLLHNEQHQYLSKTTECLDCEYSVGCIKKGIIQIMKSISEKNCIIHKEGFNKSRDILKPL